MDDLEKLTGMPKFEPEVMSVDAATLAKMADQDRLLHESLFAIQEDISCLRQENRWLAERLVRAYNRLVDHQKLIDETKKTFIGIPYRVIGWLLSGLAGALLAQFAGTVAKGLLP